MEKDFEEVLKVAKSFSNGGTQEQYQEKLGWPAERLFNSINLLTQRKRLQVLKSSQGKLIWKYQDVETVMKFQGLQQDDLLVYQTIEKSGTTGIWLKDIRFHTNLPPHVVNRCLKTLEGKNLIKSVKSIQMKNRRLYMLFELEPSKDVSGGSWYQDGEFNEELIGQLRRTCAAFIRDNMPTLEEIHRHVSSSIAGHQGLTLDDMQTIIRTLELEDVVTSVISPQTGDTRYVTLRWPAIDGFASVPCSVCPVRDQCSVGGGKFIHPESCSYLTQWLGLNGGINKDEDIL